MIKITAKINFDIVEQMDNGVGLDHLFDDLPPAKIEYDHPETKKEFIKWALDDEVLTQRAIEFVNTKMKNRKEQMA